MGDFRFQEAIAAYHKATEKDRDGLLEEALESYKIALDNFSFVRKHHINHIVKERVKEKMEHVLTRAEQIKEHLRTSNGVHDSGSKGSCPDKSSKKIASNKKEDNEEQKMKQKLEGAILQDDPNVRWSDVAGLEQAKANLQEAMILPIRFPSLFTGDRQPWKGILLYGPPGTGKTYLAKACATEVNGTFLSVSSADLMSKWQGESEKLVKALFELARASAPAIIFIDEVDSLCRARSDNDSESSRRVKTEFLVQMQGIGKDTPGVVVLGATNVPWELDSALRRRFERRVYIPLPDSEGRKQMFQLAVKNTPNTLTDNNFRELAELSKGYSGADISIIVRDALFEPVRRCQTATTFKKVIRDKKHYWTPCDPGDRDPTKSTMRIMDILTDELLPPDLSQRDFIEVLKSSRPSVGKADIKAHDDWTKMYGLEGN